MKRAVIADVGPLVAALNIRDQYHLQAQRELRQLERDGYQVLILVTTILEAYSFVLRSSSLSIAQRWLGQIEAGASPIFPGETEFNESLRVVLRYPDQDITIFDTLVSIVSDRLSIPVWTYDHHFDILGAERWYPSA